MLAAYLDSVVVFVVESVQPRPDGDVGYGVRIANDPMLAVTSELSLQHSQ